MLYRDTTRAEPLSTAKKYVCSKVYFVWVSLQSSKVNQLKLLQGWNLEQIPLFSLPIIMSQYQLIIFPDILQNFIARIKFYTRIHKG